MNEAEQTCEKLPCRIYNDVKYFNETKTNTAANEMCLQKSQSTPLTAKRSRCSP